MTFKLFDYDRGSVVAPAGCGKTQAIVDALIAHIGRPVLILTHTNAGVAALRKRLVQAGVPNHLYRVSTIDGWAMRLTYTFPNLSSAPCATKARIDYQAVRKAAQGLVSSRAIDKPIRATYSRLVVDEYQDCSRDQHALIMLLAERLNTCVLGDPLQRIFDFNSINHPHWTHDVEAAFERVGSFDKPWRWENAGQTEFGAWVLSVRPALINGDAIDLSRAPSNVRWIQSSMDPGELNLAQIRAVNDVRTSGGSGLLVIGNAKNRQSRAEFARKIPGLSVVEPVDLGDLIDAATAIDRTNGIDRLYEVLKFAQKVMTKIDIREIALRLKSLQNGTARKPADKIESACLCFGDDDGLPTVKALLRTLANSDGRVFRNHLLMTMFEAVDRALQRPGLSLVEGAVAAREHRRAVGRTLPTRSVGSTLLLKGLESEHAVLLDADDMNGRHFYVAISRASHSLTIFSKSAVLRFI